MNVNTRVQLSFMMFLNFFVWGIWFVTLGTYLTKGMIHATDGQTGWAYGTQCLGAIIAPFIIGLIADRYFAAQKILGILHLAGAALMYFISQQTSFAPFSSLLLMYMIIYMPSLALVNAISMKQMSNPKKEFSFIRMWGTIGWIASGLIIAWMAWEPAKDIVSAGTAENASSEAKVALEKAASVLKITFLVSAAVSAVLGIYSFFLPNTPPPKKRQQTSIGDIIGLDSIKLLKDKNYLTFFIASILICIPLAFYYGLANNFLTEAGMTNPAGKMTMGQIAETVFLFVMPWFFARFNIKKMLLFGMIAWVLRYILFGFGDINTSTWMLYGGIILHGICYDFFFVTGQIYTDNKAGEKIRSSAQGMITLATYGLGMLVGFWLAGKIAGNYAITDAAGKTIGHAWKNIWLIPAGIAGAITLLFALLFNDKSEAK
jgi:nucleoside transporter